MEKTVNLSKKDYNLLSIIFRSNNRRLVVFSLLNGNFFPNQIQKDTKLKFSTVSVTLKELERLGIVICTNPDDKKGRIYILSNIVKELVPVIQKWHKRMIKSENITINDLENT